MKTINQNQEPVDAKERRAIKPVISYPIDNLPKYDSSLYADARDEMKLVETIIIPPREAKTFEVPAGHFFRIVSVDGPQVGDLNLWNKDNINERFFSGKTRALYGTHVSTGDRLYSNLPFLRPMATITHDTLDWYGWDDDGGSVHDVIGTRCDPYTHMALNDEEYHHCCHSNLCRALSNHQQKTISEIESKVHDVLNVFMCTGFTKETHQYFMKASPVRPDDFIEFFAEINLVGGLSACPGGDCSSSHSSDSAKCYPLKVEIYQPKVGDLKQWASPSLNNYSRSHGAS
jgi:uncharacterized protein YcgI (DUF1989 family)|tara:strand:+ start:1999 stop:2862 length:864 start_codon:yes stop_codon:yes gene_type:complete